MIKHIVKDWTQLIRELQIYKPDFRLIWLRTGIWAFWSLICHYAWLRAFYLYPLTLICLSPMLYWSLKSLVEDSYLKVLLSVKQLFEQTAAQIGSGYAIQNALINCIETGNKSNRFHVTIEPILSKMVFKLKLNLVDDHLYGELIEHTKIEGLKTLNTLTEASLKTGSQLDQLMIYYAKLLSEQLKQRAKFRETISQKRNEFQLMLLIPVLGILMIQNMIPEYYGMLNQSLAGVVLLIAATGLYGYSAQLFYKNQDQFNEFLSTW